MTSLDTLTPGHALAHDLILLRARLEVATRLLARFTATGHVEVVHDAGTTAVRFRAGGCVIDPAEAALFDTLTEEAK